MAQEEALHSLLRICQIAAVALPLLAFGPSYLRFLLVGDWKFAGIQPTVLRSTGKADHAIVGTHVVLTLVWMFSACYQVFMLRDLVPRNIARHRAMGRVAILSHLFALCFIANSPQMASCWPITTPFGDMSRDTINTAYVILCFILHSVQGVVAAWMSRKSKDADRKAQLRREHIQFMLQGLLASSNAALMRVCIIPTVLALSTFWKRPTWPADGEWVSVGQWLWAKHVGYGIQSAFVVLPCLFPSWSPYAHEVCELMKGRLSGCLMLRAILFACLLICGVFGAAERAYSAILYDSVVGHDGCVLPEHVPSGALSAWVFVLVTTIFVGLVSMALQPRQHEHEE